MTRARGQRSGTAGAAHEAVPARAPTEGFFALLKRGLHGTFHSVSAKHLHRYLDEFAWRYSLRNVDDGERTMLAIQAGAGKRLTYREQKAGS